MRVGSVYVHENTMHSESGMQIFNNIVMHSADGSNPGQRGGMSELALTSCTQARLRQPE